jgi:hypothetical protein
MPRGSPTASAAASKRCATPSMSSTIEGPGDALGARSSRPKRTREAFDQQSSAEALRQMLHRSGREFGYDTRALGLLRWPQRLPSRRGFYPEICREVRRWLGSHNREVKESAEGVRIISCLVPKQSPWLNAIEPKWVDGKRKVVEPYRLLGAYELAERACRVFGCPHYEHLSVAQKVA